MAGVGLDDFWRPPLTQTIVWFNDSWCPLPQLLHIAWLSFGMQSPFWVWKHPGHVLHSYLLKEETMVNIMVAWTIPGGSHIHIPSPSHKWPIKGNQIDFHFIYHRHHLLCLFRDWWLFPVFASPPHQDLSQEILQGSAVFLETRNHRATGNRPDWFLITAQNIWPAISQIPKSAVLGCHKI